MSKTYEIELSGRKLARLTVPDDLASGDLDLLVLWMHNVRREATAQTTPLPVGPG